MAKIIKIPLASGNTFSYVTPEIDQVIPLYAINSTAYVVEVSYKVEDCTQKGTTICFRTDGDPIPTNLEEVRKQLKNKGYSDPHWSMQWIRRLNETPSLSKTDYTEDNVEGQTI